MHESLINIGIFRPDAIMIIEVLPKNSVIITTKASIKITGCELFTNIEYHESFRGLTLIYVMFYHNVTYKYLYIVYSISLINS